ncbi:S1C family serine protease [Halosegnis sp.]|uniref:S1C family serine protease n=1 Tax=Halosegnis sp. TaxID=2864959 RepID=UPI0035D48209
MTDRTLDRRTALKLGGTTLAAALAGCNARRTGTATGTDSTATADSGGDTTSSYADVHQATADSVVLVDPPRGQGTGFVYDDGHIVTNAHVVGEADEADIRFSSGAWTSGPVVGRDVHSDLAVVAVESMPEEATPLPFADRPAVVGEEVVVIGNPFGLGGTVTAGIVSGVDRSIPSPAGFPIPDAIQTDAAVNPGNSGGPMMRLDGTVLAVINSGGGDNIAFGISAALTTRVVPELIETGEYDHSFIGAAFTPVTPEIATANDLETARGLAVTAVLDDGPAAGVLQASEDTTIVEGRQVPVGGDILLAIDDRTLLTTEGLGSYLALETRPGETVDLTVLRAGDEQTITLELGVQPNEL